MYIKNKRDSNKFKGCSPFHHSCNLKEKCFEIAYFSYTNRYRKLKKRKQNENVQEIF
jgi:hypothetical protein